MKDEQIIELLWKRDESGLRAAEEKYAAFCHTVTSNILSMREDREECLNDMLLALWNNIPPEVPQNLKAYIARIVRNLALKKTRSENVWRRTSSFTELGAEFIEAIPDTVSLADSFEEARAGRIINEFLKSIPAHEADVFVLRYYYGEKVECVAVDMGFTVSKVKMILYRTRIRLAERLKKEGILI